MLEVLIYNNAKVKKDLVVTASSQGYRLNARRKVCCAITLHLSLHVVVHLVMLISSFVVSLLLLLPLLLLLLLLVDVPRNQVLEVHAEKVPVPLRLRSRR